MEPSPEELAIIQKYCKHQTLIVEKSVHFLKPGEDQPTHCDNCGKKIKLKVKWDSYISDDEGPVCCEHCGDFIKKGEQYKNKEPWAHEKCEFPDW